MERPREWPGWWTDDLAILMLRHWDPFCVGAHVPEDEYATEASEIAEVLRIGGDLQGVLEAMRRIVDRNRRGVEIDAQRDRRAAEAIMEWYTSRKAELPEA